MDSILTYQKNEHNVMVSSMEIDYQHFRNVYSTNTWGLQNAQLLTRNHLTVISADEQSAGRGRFSNRWQSPAHQNIYATFCLFVNAEKSVVNLPQVLALAVVEMLQEMDVEAKIKWPNDLYIGNKKIGGILSETIDFGKERFIAMGLGFNVNMPLEEVSKIDKPATSLLLETGKEFEVKDLIKNLSERLVKKLALFLEEGFACFLADFKSHMILGQDITFKDGSQKIYKGKGIDILDDGSFKMLLENGTPKVFHSGELIDNQ